MDLRVDFRAGVWARLKTLRSEVRTLKVWRTGENQRVASGLVGE